MKRTYQKPQLLYEDFSLSGCLIASCQIKNTALEVGECAIPVNPSYDTGKYIFDTTVVSPCNVQAPADSLGPYDVSGENYSLFSS